MKKILLSLMPVLISAQAWALPSGFEGCWVYPKSVLSPGTQLWLRVDRTRDDYAVRIFMAGKEIFRSSARATYAPGMDYPNPGLGGCTLFGGGGRRDQHLFNVSLFHRVESEEVCNQGKFVVTNNPNPAGYDGSKQFEIRHYYNGQMIANLTTFEPFKVDCP